MGMCPLTPTDTPTAAAGSSTAQAARRVGSDSFALLEDILGWVSASWGPQVTPAAAADLQHEPFSATHEPHHSLITPRPNGGEEQLLCRKGCSVSKSSL